MAQEKTSKSGWMKGTMISAVAAAILFCVANSAVWVNRYIFDTNNFTNVATTSITSESSRNAIAGQIVNKALEDYPTARNVIGNSATNVISGILGSDQVENILTKVISKLQVAVTSNNQQSITIDLSGPKDLITKVVDVVGQYRDIKINPDNIPSEITILDKDKIPDFYKYSVVFLWLGPIAFIGAVVLIIFPYAKWRSDYKIILATQSAALLLASLFGLLVGPLFRPPILSRVATPEGRTVVGNLYNAFIATFNHQTVMLVWVGVLGILVSSCLILVPKFRQAFNK